MPNALQMFKIDPEHRPMDRILGKPMSGKKCGTPRCARLRIPSLPKNPGHKRRTPSHFLETNIRIIHINLWRTVFHKFPNTNLRFCDCTNLSSSFVRRPDLPIFLFFISITTLYKIAPSTPTAASNNETNDAQ